MNTLSQYEPRSGERGRVSAPSEYHTQGAAPTRGADATPLAGGVLLLGVLCFFFGAISYYTYVDLDVYHELALARETWALGHVPTSDLYAYTPTLNPAVDHEWGTGIVLYAVTVASGLGSTGLMLLKNALVLGIALGCYVVARRRGASALLLAVLAVPAIQLAVFGFSTVRAQVFTMFFTVCLLLFLEQDERGRRGWIAVWLPLAVIWLNMHGGYLVGVGLLGLYMVEGFVREFLSRRSLVQALRAVGHLVLTVAATLLLTLVNPWGSDYVRMLRRVLSLERKNIPEWWSLWQIPMPGVMLTLFGLSLVLVIYAIRVRGLAKLRGVPLVLVTAYLSTRHMRHLPLYAIIWLCYVPSYLEGTSLARALHETWSQRLRFGLALGILLGLTGSYTALHNQVWRLQIPTMPGERDLLYPTGAVQYLSDQSFTGNVMASFEMGAFVSWKLYPAVKVGYDSRYDLVYPPRFFDEIADFYQALDGWQQTLTRYPTDAVLVAHNTPLHQLLVVDRAMPSGWELVYRDAAYAIVMRSELAAHLPHVDRTTEYIAGSFP